LIDGVEKKDLSVFLDDRGYLYEILRFNDKIFEGAKFEQITFSHLFPGVVNGFHYHKKQTDWIVCAEGNVRVVLVDFRKHIPAGDGVEGREHELKKVLVPEIHFIGERKPLLLKVPKGVWHGYSAVGNKPASIIYVTDCTYDPNDEFRVPWDFLGKSIWEVENK
jgi:dTDP-4-dehydrorhamnose 3,5-epimerase